ncbi:MAG: DUF1501 domain-containing protein [Thiolinea sp.]
MITNNMLKRRDFIRSLLGAGAVGALGPVGQLALMREATAATPAFSDYKALVCIFLYGGNDSFNMVIPNGDDSVKGYAQYQSIRGSLAVADTELDYRSLNAYHVDNTEEKAYRQGMYSLQGKGIDLGINAVMPELAELVNKDKASVISNIGNLVKSVDRASVRDGKDLPLFLFAHNHQQRALQTGQGNNLNDVGWAGRIADNWSDVNGSSPLGLNISYAGSDRMLIGKTSVPLAIKAGATPVYNDMEKDKNNTETDRRALFRALAGLENASSTGNLNFNNTNTFQTSDPFRAFYGAAARKSLDVFDLLTDALGAHTITYSSKDSYGNDLFSVPTADQLGFGNDIGGGLIREMESVARMIDIGAKNAFGGSAHNRQIFMVKLGGFDTHSAQISKHPLLLRELSLALGKFQAALEERGHANKVTTFTMSDFGRTMSNNGDGTDHAWGAHHLVIGGDGDKLAGNLRGGQMIGTLPDISLDGADDYSAKGRIIPTIAQDQLNATLCRWFGVDNDLMPVIFPNLSNFGTIDSAAGSAYLNDLFV